MGIVGIDRAPSVVRNAVERFLGREKQAISTVVEQTIDGNLRAVMAASTPEELASDQSRFAAEVLRETEGDLEKLGLRVYSLGIASISDEHNYLQSLARKRIAEVLRAAEMAESAAAAALGGYRGNAGKPPDREGLEVREPETLATIARGERSPSRKIFVISGAQREGNSDAPTYRFVHGRRPRHNPLLEVVDVLDVSPFEVDLELSSVLTKGFV